MPPTFRMTKWEWLLLGASVALLAAILALSACSRPPPPHPETVAPATDDHPAEECPGECIFIEIE